MNASESPVVLRLEFEGDNGGLGDLPFEFTLGEGAKIAAGTARFGAGSLAVGEKGNALSGAIPLDSPFRREIGKMTALVWVHLSEPSTTGFSLLRRISKGIPNPGSFLWVLTGHRTLYFTARSAEGEAFDYSTEPVAIYPGDWAHLGMTFDGGEVTFYVNGERVETKRSAKAADATLSVIPEAGETHSIFGIFLSAPDGSQCDDCLIILNEALSAEEVRKAFGEGLSAIQAK